MSKAVNDVIAEHPDRAVTEREAARFLGYSMTTLAHWRMKGTGPKFIKFKSGSVRYKMSALVEYTQTEAVQTDEKVG